MEENNITHPQPVQYKRTRSFFWPILLITGGVLLLLSNLGIVPWNTWNLLWRFWPLILVAVGIDVLFGHRSAVGAVISAFLILCLIAAAAGIVFFAEQLPVLSRYVQESPWQTDYVEHTLDDYESATVLIDWTSLHGNLGAVKDTKNLIEGEITYQGDLIFDVRSQGSNADVRLDTRATETWFVPSFQVNPNKSWDVFLTTEIPLDLTLDSGSGSCDFDLSELLLEELFLDSGSGSINITLPDGQSYPVKIDSGSGSLTIFIPENAGLRIEIDSGSGSFHPGSRFDLVSGEKNDDGVWESKNYDSADYILEMEIDQGSGSISFR